VIVGIFSTLYNTPAYRIARLNQNGTIDPSFITSSGFNNFARTVDVNNSGQIIVTGYFTTYQGIPSPKIALLNTNGSLDLTFSSNIGLGFNGNPEVAKFYPGGKIIIGGSFVSYNGVTARNIVRLNIDGTLDLPFIGNMGTGFDLLSVVKDIVIQPLDNKILVGGSFLSYDSNNRNRIIRLNPDGTIDNSFVIGTGFNNTVETIKLQPNGQILVGGQFTSYSGITCNKIIRLNVDGSPDMSFITNIGIGFDVSSRVTRIDLQSTGKIIVGGSFTLFNGNPRSKILRLNQTGTFDSTFGLCNVSTPVPGFVTPNATDGMFSIAIDNQDNMFVAVNGNYNPNCYPGIALGSGQLYPEPSDMAINRIVNFNLVGTFSSSNAKYIVLITDNSPGGNDDIYNSIDQQFVQNTLIPSCVINNIKVVLVKPPNAPIGMLVLDQLATTTGGQVIITPFNENFNINAIATSIATLC
jgi:uncharacterized delta-60 repeat protein